MKQKGIPSFVLIFLLLLTACQPTPEHEIVINMGDNTLEELINATAAPTAVPTAAPTGTPVPERLPESTMLAEAVVFTPEPTPEPYSAPECIKESYPLGVGSAQVIFDAPVSVPFTDRYQVYEVSKGKPTAEQARQILRTFFGDTPLYRGVYRKTKAELAELIKICDEDPASIEKNKGMQTAPGWGFTLQDFLLEEMETAPLEREDAPFDIDTATFRIRAYGRKASDNTVYIVDMDDRDDFCSLDILADEMYTPDERLVFSGTYPGAPSGQRLNALSLSREEALAAADAFLTEAGIEWMAPSLSECLPAQYLNAATNVEVSQGWKLIYHHRYNGITGVNQKYSGTLAEDQYQSPWQQETVELYVDSTGVRSFFWYGMSNVEEVKENELTIKPFPEILAIIKRRLKVENAYAEVDKTREIRVTNIELGYCVIPKKNDPTRGYTVPAWIVSYTEEGWLGDAPHTSYHDFVIDAVTGSNIQTAAAN